jgi:hypothetical protein
MNPLIQLTKGTLLFLAVFVFACLGLLPKAQAVVPAPDGGYPGGNTAEGQNALLSRTTGTFNSALGFFSLSALTAGNFCTGVGAGALLLTTADANTAVGFAALLSNTTGAANTATGYQALFQNATGDYNTANGAAALSNTTGSNNVALGSGAGLFATTGSGNVYIGAGMQGVTGESDACYIRSIFGQTTASGIPVLINSSNKLGTTTSSKRFKEDIKPMDKASEALFALNPVTFRYKKDIDPDGIPQCGLVAEEVEKVNPDLVVRDKEGKPYSVRYDHVNAMLLNEFLKEHRKNEEQQATIARQQKQIEVLAAGLQKVNARLEVIRPAPQTAVNNP